MTGCNRPYRWLDWEEEILLQNRCRLTITELLSRINERRIAEGLAAANHSVDDNKMVEQPISQQLSFDFWRIQS